MKTDITVVAAPCSPPTAVAASSEVPASLPLVNIHNVSLALAAAPDEELPFYDASDTQPWLNPAPRSHWLSLPPLAQQISHALHFQLEQCSRSALASAMLHVIPPELSKLLAAVLICSQQRWEILWQIGLTGGLELIHTLISAVAGATSTAAALSAFPGLLMIWLQKQQVPLGMTLTDTLVLLLTTGLHICATENLAQPGWLLKLHDEVIAPVTRLGQEYGITEALTAGITLILGLYTMLRLTGWLEGKTPPPNAINHGIRMIRDICRLSTISSDYQQRHYQQLAEARGHKALSRAVVRCMSKQQLLLREARGQHADRAAMDDRASAEFSAAWRQTERQILTGQLSRCSEQPAVFTAPGDAPAASPSSRAAASSALIMSGAVATRQAVLSGWRPGCVGWSLAAAGTALLTITGTRFLRDALSPDAPAPQPAEGVTNASGNQCLLATMKIRQLLKTDKTGVPLAVELFDYLINSKGDLNFTRADQLLSLWNIQQFTSQDRYNMNSHLLYVLSLLLRRNDNDNPTELRESVFQMRHTVNFIWRMMINDRRIYSINEIINKLRMKCNNLYLSLGINNFDSMKKITEFIISHVSPDLLIFERNGQGNAVILSKEMYYMWNYIANHLADDQYIMNDEFPVAIIEGRMDSFVISRLRSYPFYNVTHKREVMEKLFERYNHHMYAYHKLDTKLEAIPILTLDDTIQSEYPGIEMEKNIIFESDYPSIHLKAPFGEESRVLYRCKTYRDIIRNFEDGFRVLHNYLPEKVPRSLRNYSENVKPFFTLNPHPDLTTLYQKFSDAYQAMTERHVSLYTDIVNKSFDILPDEEKIFIKKNTTQLNAIIITAKRLKTLRYILYPRSFRFSQPSINHPFYNTRPYFETGVFFSAWDTVGLEKRFYEIDIEHSRKKTRQYPTRRLDIKHAREIINLEPIFLNKHFVFVDGEPLLPRCNEVIAPVIAPTGHWESLVAFTHKYYEYYKNRFCNTFKSPMDTIITYNEVRLGNQNTTGYQELIHLATENRRKLLVSQKEILMNRTSVEMEKSRGNLQQILQFLPFSACVDMANDLIFSREESSHSSTMMSTLEAITCAADLYTGYSIRSSFSLLVKSLRERYAAYWLRKMLLKKFTENLLRTSGSSRGYPQAALDKISNENELIRLIDLDIAELQGQIYRKLGDLVSVPVYSAFPYLSFKSGEEFIFANIPWGINLVRMYTKSNIRHFRSQDIQLPWSNPHSGTLLIEEMHSVTGYPVSNITCYARHSPTENITLDIFELQSGVPTVYHKLYITALNNPYPRAIIAKAGEEGWIIPTSYNQMAMFCFISLTTLVRHYTGIILDIEHYYKTKKNDIKITEKALYQYYSDSQSRSDIPLPVTLKPVQIKLVNQCVCSMKAILASNLQGVEINYLFLIQYLLMRTDVAAVLRGIYSQPENKQHVLERMQLELSWNLERLTIYATRHSSTQKKFLDAVISYFLGWARELTEFNPGQLALFSPNLEVFLLRLTEYDHPPEGELLPSPLSFATNWLRISKGITEIYQSFARIEYSARVLAEFPPEQWQDEKAQLSWRAALQYYLTPEMRYEDLSPVLIDATRQLSESWLQRENATDSKPVIIENDKVNPQFITEVRKALIDSCASHPELFFSKYYQTENGYWFTFLTNDFITHANKRSRRQAYTPHPAWPLTTLLRPSLRESFVAPVRERLAIWQPRQPFDNQQLYQQLLNSIPDSFAQFAMRPFHLRLYCSMPQDGPPPSSSAQQQGIALINSVINEHGDIVEYQLRILARYLPALNVADNLPLLQILSDIFQAGHPQAPPLYPFIFQQLHTRLTQSALLLSELRQSGFIVTLTMEIRQRYQSQLRQTDSDTQRALQRYITAALRLMLSFTRYLNQLEPLLAAAPLHTFPAQWLCLGAIITRQLSLSAASANELLQLAQAAIGDSGLLSLSETAIQQTALLGDRRPAGRQVDAVAEALKVIAACVQQATKQQQQVLLCLENNQQLHALLEQLSFPVLSDERGRQLSSLITSAVERQHQLLDLTLIPLSSQKGVGLAAALRKQLLRIRWYSALHNDSHQRKVAGLAFHIADRQFFLLPLGNALNAPLIFRQLTQLPADNELPELLLGASSRNYTLDAPVDIKLPAGQYGDNPLSMISSLMHAEATTRVSALMTASDSSGFNRQKEQLENWLAGWLFFYHPQEEGDAIQQRAEHLTMITEHPVFLNWLHPEASLAAGTSAVSRFSQAISEVMGAYTDWPELTEMLRTAQQRTAIVQLASLPAPLFAGFWWDPATRFCYLGWIRDNQRTLYASVAEDRERLYLLSEDSASAGLWQQLVTFDWLKKSLRALREGTLAAERFFSDSLPFAWHLHCAITGASPLPASAFQRYGYPGVYTLGSGKDRQFYYSPLNAQQALPVTLTDLPGGGYRVEFLPQEGSVSADLAFTLEMSQTGSFYPDEGNIILPQLWKLTSAHRAAQLISEGNFSPHHYLQWTSAAPDGVMMPLARVLQHSDGSVVFIFSENNGKAVSYRVVDAEGLLRPSPLIPRHWPRNINASGFQQLAAAVDRFFAQHTLTDYWLFPQEQEQQAAEAELSALRQQASSVMGAAVAAIQGIPFRLAEDASLEDELFHINIYFHSHNLHFYHEVKKRAGMENSAITLGDLRWKLLDWRQEDFTRQDGADRAIQTIAQQIQLLESMFELLTHQPAIHYRSMALQQWINHNLDMLSRAQTAMKFIRSLPVRSYSTDEITDRLQQQRFAQNYFFGFYTQQLHATADFFQQPWQCVRDNRGFPYPFWQSALDQLHSVTSGLTSDIRQLDRLLTLPDALWQTTEMQQYAQLWLQVCQNATLGWQTPRQAEHIILLRPKASEQGVAYIPQKYHWPVRLMLAAGRGSLIGKQDEGTAPPLPITPEQHHDLLLTRSAPGGTTTTTARLAGIAWHPRDARGFAELAKLRLSSPWALAEFSTAAFMARLQRRIRRAAEQDEAQWGPEEREFYRCADTRLFLQRERDENSDRQYYRQFFRQLFNSNLLVTRLIMPDVEMVFGFLCDAFIERYPTRATEEVSAAWFLFLENFEQDGEGDLWLVGI